MAGVIWRGTLLIIYFLGLYGVPRPEAYLGVCISSSNAVLGVTFGERYPNDCHLEA